EAREPACGPAPSLRPLPVGPDGAARTAQQRHGEPHKSPLARNFSHTPISRGGECRLPASGKAFDHVRLKAVLGGVPIQIARAVRSGSGGAPATKDRWRGPEVRPLTPARGVFHDGRGG